MTDHYGDLADLLAQEARLFAARAARDESSGSTATTLIVADFEYAYDHSRHSGYSVAEGAAAERKIRWPFHRIVGASWLVLRITPGEDVAAVTELVAHAADDMNEQQICVRFFEALDRHSGAQLVTWGGEAKDLAVLRRCAAEFGLVLPRQLANPSPHARERLDLCRATAVTAVPVHLPEFCHATGIPTKPAPSKEVGQLVEHGNWPAVREQALGDVLATSVIGLRHLAAHGVIAIDRERSAVAIGAAAAEQLPDSAFVQKCFRPWARDRLRAAGLKGTVFRAG